MDALILVSDFMKKNNLEHWLIHVLSTSSHYINAMFVTWHSSNLYFAAKFNVTSRKLISVTTNKLVNNKITLSFWNKKNVKQTKHIVNPKKSDKQKLVFNIRNIFSTKPVCTSKTVGILLVL